MTIHKSKAMKFANHQIVSDDGVTVLLHDSDESWNCWFRISFLPRCMLVYGDIDEIVVGRAGCKTSAEMRRWAISAVDSQDYFLEKQPMHLRNKDFSEERAEEICIELEIPEMDWTFLDDEEQQAQFYEHLSDNDVTDAYEYSAMVWSSGTMCAYEAVKRFAQLMKEGSQRSPHV